ncbi:putative secreted protein (Por secretion system target) [Dysgonomonas alginatilytica]|uniref:Putative secreted protein (Por secretion system target) n=1 Tax=Dysgonomonas alginatilytica TaxID=1605892 RepID=A0A2V3PNQ8_9BACT|nr:T9SS type A sorting domain-containing protein [Dysgonomonas alginatilytica]PXV64138.1 putative secreted protein (Por secretion system target) [Dysgonomonas alginatilytica]
MINKQILIILVSLISSLSVFSQISEGGTPPSFRYKNSTRSALSVSQVPVNLDISRLTWEDEMVEQRKDAPLRIAKVIPVNINIDSIGSWTTFSDSVKIWQQVIEAEGAQGLILGYKDFYIPEGAKLYVYNEDHSRILGAYTRNTHPQGGKFASEIIAGDKITLEYVASTISNESPRIVVEDVGYVYGDNFNTALRALPTSPPRINSSQSCMINVNCADGANWKDQKRGVVLYQVKLGGNWFVCSGSLVNNTKRDGTPYLLTASHCFNTNGIVEYETIVVYFNHEFPGCENEDVFPVTSRTLVGTDLLVQMPLERISGGIQTHGSDGALLKLKNNIPLEYKVFFNGWDRRDVAASSGVVIHHPNGDVKKIVTFLPREDLKTPVTTETYRGGSGYNGATNGFWGVFYDGRSATQGGSSGSPIFSQNGLIVGTLTGGVNTTDYCLYRNSQEYFGKFGYHFDYLEDESMQMKKYLDPINEGTLYLRGYDPNNPLGIEEPKIDNSPQELVVFPTLADNEVNINANSIIRTIKVYDLNGRQVYSKSGYNASTTTISVDSWTKGVYSILVQTESKKLSGKFIKK